MSTLSAELQYKINEYDLYRKNEKIFAEKTGLQKKFIVYEGLFFPIGEWMASGSNNVHTH
jgi:hypothetical protein